MRPGRADHLGLARDQDHARVAMKARIINLASADERRAHMRREMAKTGLDHEFVEAIDVATLSDDERTALIDEAAVARHPRWLTPGQLGCALSHRHAYERAVADGDRVALVFEDDAVLPADCAALVEELAAQMSGSEVVLLYFRSFAPCRFSSVDAVDLERGAKLMFPMDISQPNCASAYLLTREAAQRLAEAVVPVRAGADSWGFFHAEGAVDVVRCVVPSAAGVRTDFKSTIGYLPPNSLRMRITRKASEGRIFPIQQLLTWRRRALERKMTRYEVVPDSSPLAATR
jgi:glycosyl transferase family 25